MKKFLSVIIFIALISAALILMKNSFAPKEEKVVEISTISPYDTICFYVSKDVSLNDEIHLEKGYIISGRLEDINIPEDWHHNSTFVLIPETYTDLNGKKHQLQTEIRITFKEKEKSDNDPSEITVGTGLFYPFSIEDTKSPLFVQEKEYYSE